MSDSVRPHDGSPSGSTVPGILQARTLEWVAISFSNAWKWKVNVKSLSRVRLLATPRTAAYQGILPPWDSPGKSTGVGCHCLLHFKLNSSYKSLTKNDYGDWLLGHKGKKFALLPHWSLFLILDTYFLMLLFLSKLNV